MDRLLKILIVEDDPSTYDLLALHLKSHAETKRASTLQEALDSLVEFTPDVIVLDCNLPDSNAVQAIAMIPTIATHGCVVVLTGHTVTEDGVLAIKQGADDYLSKDLVTDGKKLWEAISSAWARYQRRALQSVKHMDDVSSQISNASAEATDGSLPSLFHKMIPILHDIRETQTLTNGRISIIETKVSNIESQTTKTNGRVNSIEEQRASERLKATEEKAAQDLKDANERHEQEKREIKEKADQEARDKERDAKDKERAGFWKGLTWPVTIVSGGILTALVAIVSMVWGHASYLTSLNDERIKALSTNAASLIVDDRTHSYERDIDGISAKLSVHDTKLDQLNSAITVLDEHVQKLDFDRNQPPPAPVTTPPPSPHQTTTQTTTQTQ